MIKNIVFLILLSSVSMAEGDIAPLDQNSEQMAVVQEENAQTLQNNINDSTDIENDDEAPVRAVQNPNLGLDDYENVARNIYNVQNAMSDTYPVGEGMMFTMYILRYMAEVGEYILPSSELMKLVSAFETIIGDELDLKVQAIIKQIDKLQFGKSGSHYYVKIFSKSSEGVFIPIDEAYEDDKVKKIDYAIIENKALIKFKDLDRKRDISSMRRFITEKVNIPLFSESWLPTMNNLHPQLDEAIRPYLDTELKVNPLEVTFKRIFVKVDTSTLFGSMKFYLRKAYTLPGITYKDEFLPPLLLRMRAKFINVKVSIDQ